ncbi:MFS transporter [Cryobacterium adonitolivorans]|uniref:MFS transporter n=1 Tax=Cryobacterium adonitolivorans TaxID=1259189 RepID=A0A4R8WCD2_9MICO|nr:MFS transporter [Cryobacterium adonitolivorans]TFC05147.1 MFS transporter [Cryobacterium adonitolivorans]
MSAPTTIRPVAGIRRSRVAVSASYAAQGFGYAVVVTSLPNLKTRHGIDDIVVSLIVLLVCLAAAGGSLLADRLAVRWGSRVALVVGLLLEAVALPLIASPVGLPAFIAAFAIYGAGLGIVDAAGAMQGVLVQQRAGVSVMAGFFAWYTGAAIAGALLMSAVAGTAANAGIALVAGAVVALAIAIVGVRGFDPRRTKLPSAPDAARHGKLPHRGITVFGTVVLAAFVVDSAVSTWSTVYLHDVLLTGAAIAPLGYAAYQAAILVTRIGADRLVRRFGRVVLAVCTTVLAILGCLVVATMPVTWAAVAGFALAGFGVGALVPLAFSAAGELHEARSDEVIARVNLFNYAGAVLGAVLVGLLADSTGLAQAFLVPMVMLIPVLFLARRFAPRQPRAAAPVPAP